MGLYRKQSNQRLNCNVLDSRSIQMELIFLFINQSKNGYISKQGFNFSPNYKFKVIIEDTTYVLNQEECNKKLPDCFFDDTGCISNITAVVGKNGSGKSTLLNEICSPLFSVKDENHESIYDDYFDDRYTKEKRIAIYKENETLICYHNIVQFRNDTNIRDEYLYQGSVSLQNMVRNNLGFENISKILLTNSMYSIRNSMATHMNIQEIYLNIDTLNMLKDMFYKRKIKTLKRIAGGYFSYLDLCRSQKKASDFQQILDVMYIKDIKNEKGVLLSNLKPDLNISFQLYTKVIQEILFKEKRKVDENEKNILVESHKVLRNHIDNRIGEILKTDKVFVAYFNLLFEIIAFCRAEDFYDVGVIHNRDELKLSIEHILRKKSDVEAFFREAFNEIEEFEKCLNNCVHTKCLLPMNDIAYDLKIEIRYGSKEYKGFLNLIEKYMIQKKYSFIAKYIQIEGLQFSSGERALLNFFSWIHMLPFFKYISNDVQESLSDNVLLLIDEIDLYCHPEWQQKMLYHLIDEIKSLFRDKRVQIIFTTHSPIILSDMPKCNVVYLIEEEGKKRCKIDVQKNHDETFGANIYKLFSDAFFLEKQGQVGEFAKEKIRQIIDRMKPDREENGKYIYRYFEDNITELEQEISLIGEPIIRDRLYTMLYKHKMEVEEGEVGIQEKMIKVYEEKIRKLRNGENR